MEKVYSCENSLTAQHVKNLLENAGIECIVKNESMQSTAGEVPPIATWPEIWILNPDDKSKAESIIQAQINGEEASQGEQWVCENCKETNEGSFNICWNCNSSR